jgi:hypothetical protein
MCLILTKQLQGFLALGSTHLDKVEKAQGATPPQHPDAVVRAQARERVVEQHERRQARQARKRIDVGQLR